MAERKSKSDQTSTEPVEADRYNEPRPEQKSGEGEDAGQAYVRELRESEAETPAK